VITEAIVAPPFGCISEASAKDRLCIPISILSIGEGRNPLEMNATVPSNVIVASFLLFKLYPQFFYLFSICLLWI